MACAGANSRASRQSNGTPLPPGRTAPFGGLASISSASAASLYSCGFGEIGGLGDADRLDRGDAELALDFRDPLGALAPVQLQIVGLGRGDDRGERLVVGVDAQRDDFRALPGAGGEVARLGRADAARALLEEHEADHVGPRVERRRQGRDGREAADFYRRGHAPLSDKTSGVSKGRGGARRRRPHCHLLARDDGCATLSRQRLRRFTH